ncbi:8-amino-7-oxononanoate synthase [Edwardsiella tarda]|uniref:8-amino-7-oxononanoate synthase n=1 Tax=Edwardsiella tarda TaxID=636 RepID=UPI0019682090|nr:8-amino-7-oxononanoate synthase [Edwardsiella tarda]
MGWQTRLSQALAARQAADAYRRRTVREASGGREIVIAGRRYLNFAANDYLGLSQHPAPIAAWQQGLTRYGSGSGGSAHVTGQTTAHAALEAELADWLGYPRALLFISGFAANQALILALMQRQDRVLADKLSHASLMEAAMLAPSVLRRFQHNQPDSLARLLATPHEGESLVVTEGIFSMDGDSAPLAALRTLCDRHAAWLMVDDAHGVGVCGREGRGSCDAQGVRPDLLIVTFGKAFGISGAALLCSEPLAEYLLQFARHLIYSTSMPPAQACALRAALQVVRQADSARARLASHVARLRQALAGGRWRLADSHSAIQPLIVGENQAALALAQRLRARGLWVCAMRPPTVPPGSARLRITLSAAHRTQDIERLLEALDDADA